MFQMPVRAVLASNDGGVTIGPEGGTIGIELDVFKLKWALLLLRFTDEEGRETEGEYPEVFEGQIGVYRLAITVPAGLLDEGEYTATLVGASVRERVGNEAPTELSQMKVEELKALAAERGVKIASRDRKADLVTKLAAEIPAAGSAEEARLIEMPALAPKSDEPSDEGEKGGDGREESEETEGPSREAEQSLENAQVPPPRRAELLSFKVFVQTYDASPALNSACRPTPTMTCVRIGKTSSGMSIASRSESRSTAPTVPSPERRTDAAACSSSWSTSAATCGSSTR